MWNTCYSTEPLIQLLLFSFIRHNSIAYYIHATFSLSIHLSMVILDCFLDEVIVKNTEMNTGLQIYFKILISMQLLIYRDVEYLYHNFHIYGFWGASIPFFQMSTSIIIVNKYYNFFASFPTLNSNCVFDIFTVQWIKV